MTIAEFLLARIAEDEMVATVLCASPADLRILRECAAKRAILKEHELSLDMRDPYCDTCAEWWHAELGEGPPMVPYPCPTTKALATVYSDHPDYKHEWKAE